MGDVGGGGGGVIPSVRGRGCPNYHRLVNLQQMNGYRDAERACRRLFCVLLCVFLLEGETPR